LFFAKPETDIIGKTGIIWNGHTTGIDIRIGNQYVVVPPSFRDDVPVPNKTNEFTPGVYSWKRPLVTVAELPALPNRWIDEFLPHRNAKNNVNLTLSKQTYSNTAERCRAYLEQVEPCIAGQHGDAQLYKTACIIFWDFGLSETEGMPLLQEYNLRCQPPWSQSRLDYKMNEVLTTSHPKERGHLPDVTKEINKSVDLSEFMVGSSIKVHDHSKQKLSPDDDNNEPLFEVPPIPTELFRVPGFVSEVMDYCLENASYPIPAMAFGGALTLQSFLCGRKVREPGDLRTNLYLLALANASAGKDYARKVIKAIAREIGASYGIGDKFSSGQAIEDSLLLNPNLLFLCDEFDAILNSIKKGKDTTSDMITSTLLTLYTSANTFYDRRRKADIKKIEQINQPHLTILGTATRDNYFASLSKQMLEGGLFARMIVLDAGKRPRGQDSQPPDNIIERERVLETAKWWYSFDPGGGNLSNVNPTPLIVPFDSDAKDNIKQYREFTEDEYSKAEDHGNGVAMAVWGRATENATKLALLAACSERYKEPIIMPTHTQWAVQFNDHQVRHALYLASVYSANTEFDAKVKKALQELRKLSSDQLMPEWKLRRKLGLPPNEFDAVVSELVRRRLAVFEAITTKGRPQSGFRILR
jgi:hypothetical protein